QDVLLVDVVVLAVADQLRLVELLEDRPLGFLAAEIEPERREVAHFQAPDAASARLDRNRQWESIRPLVGNRRGPPGRILLFVTTQLADVRRERDVDRIL